MSKFTLYEFVVADRAMIASGKRYAFRTYTDRAGMFGNPGAEVLYNDGTKDKQNRPVGKGFAVDQSHYKLQAREGQKDSDNKPLFEFFMNAPFCEGSPNGDYTDADGIPVPQEKLLKRDENIRRLKSGEITQLNVKIKVMDSDLDAQVALETGVKRVEAQMSASKIDDATLTEVAAMLGFFGDPEQTMRYKVFEYAGKRPLDYFNILNAGDRAIRALIRKGIADRVLTTKGEIILWKDTILGNDENAAVSTLLGDSAMLTALQDNIDFKVEVKKPKGKK